MRDGIPLRSLTVRLNERGSNSGHCPVRLADNSPDTEAYAREKVRALEMAIAELPPDLKSPLILIGLEGCSYARTGELLGITGKAVEMKVYRARKILLEKMRNLGF